MLCWEYYSQRAPFVETCSSAHVRSLPMLDEQINSELLPLPYNFSCSGMSREAGELQRTASPFPLGPNDGYSKGPPTVSSTDISPELVPEDSFPAALADSNLIAARHRHHEAKENITAALIPAYSHEKVYQATRSTGSCAYL